MLCPWCDYQGRALRGRAPRPSNKRARVCPACRGLVPTKALDYEDDDHEVTHDADPMG